MAYDNTMVPAQQKPKFSVAIQTPGYQKLINQTLGDPETAKRFTAAITSAVAVNPGLQECDAGTILSGALLGESLKLSPSPQLGQYYLVPFKDKKRGSVAAFILGWKGYLQLAIRSGQYKYISCVELKQGELVKYDRISQEIVTDFITDDLVREKMPTVGYIAQFQLTNGYTATLHWSKEKMMVHADQFSQAFSLGPVTARDPKYNKVSYEDFLKGVPKSEEWKYSSFWYKDFDGMALKTMLRQLISKQGVMSIEMQNAFDNDGSLNENGNIFTVEGDETHLPSATIETDFEEVEESPIVDEAPKSVSDEVKPKKTKRSLNLDDV